MIINDGAGGGIGKERGAEDSIYKCNVDGINNNVKLTVGIYLVQFSCSLFHIVINIYLRAMLITFPIFLLHLHINLLNIQSSIR